MSVFAAPAYDNHEALCFHSDPASGLRTIVAIHNSRLGPATGGCRMYPYLSEEQALDDVLRLSRGMSLKSALAGLPLGGGKAVIIGDPHRHKTPALLQAMGRVVASLNGRYITAEDSGIGPDDLAVMGKETEFLAGVSSHGVNGDPSPYTAEGVYLSLESALRYRFSTEKLTGLRVAIQGVGAVGLHLTERLLNAGAEVQICDIYPQQVHKAQQMGAKVIGVEDFIGAEVDVLMPCAMGGVFTENNVNDIRASLIVGAANNQLATAQVDTVLKQRKIVYAPDFIVNAGGIIKVHYERSGQSDADCLAHIQRIPAMLEKIFTESLHHSGTQFAAEVLAQNILSGGKTVALASGI